MRGTWGRIDQPSRWATPGWLVQLSVAIVLLLAADLARLLADAALPGVLPFPLLFPAVLIATLTAGWRSGAIVVVLGGGYIWTIVMRHGVLRQGQPFTSADLVNVALYAGSVVAIIAFAQAYRTRARRLAAEDARHLDERDRSLASVRELFQNAPGFMAVVSGPDYVFDFANRSYHRLVGQERLEGLPLAKAIPRFPHRLFEMLDRVRASGQPLSGHGVPVLLRPSGASESEERFLEFVLQPILGPDGQVDRIYLEGFDVTEALRAQVDLRESETRLRLASEAARIGVWQSHPTRGFLYNEELGNILGVPPEVRLTADEVRDSYLPGELERVRAYVAEAYARGERHLEAELQLRRADGEVRWILLRAEVAPNAEGLLRGACGVMIDITERKDSEQRVRLLSREVDHRANNLLTVILGVVKLSKASTAEGLKSVLLGRISALGRAHQLLSDARWEGADLRRLVDEELLAFSLGEASRATVEGPDVALTPPAAQGLAMALHELATNAMKHGALSRPEGHVDVSWTRTDQGGLLLNWAETGGPPVAQPTRRGLGATILDRALAGPLAGATRLHWRPEGLACELELPQATLGEARP